MPQISEIMQALQDPRAYPEQPDNVEVMQTQMSVVFIAGEFVYKVKKPVNLGFLDYSTLEQRLFYCRKEVELNRRLCPQAYLGVAGITESDGAWQIDGKDEPVEYAVRMRYLPQDRMLNVLLGRDAVTPEMIDAVAGKIAAFHQQAETSPEISAFGGLDTIRQNTDENFSQTESYIGTAITPEQYRSIMEYTKSFIAENESLFQGRVDGGRIRDCHGDLHAAHICFCDDLCIYDCIEFNDRFRYSDVASEVAFLAMDLDRYGRMDLSGRFVASYLERSGDKELEELLDFYRCYRAYVRGKVSCFQYADPQIPEQEKGEILNTAKSYFELAQSYIA
jgi:aminoglycoside phosphotransferase family enzyme